MNKDKVRQAFKIGNGKAITEALKEYYAEQFKVGKIQPLEFYKAGDLQKEIKSEKNDIVDQAEEIFSY